MTIATHEWRDIAPRRRRRRRPGASGGPSCCAGRVGPTTAGRSCSARPPPRVPSRPDRARRRGRRHPAVGAGLADSGTLTSWPSPTPSPARPRSRLRSSRARAGRRLPPVADVVAVGGPGPADAAHLLRPRGRRRRHATPGRATRRPAAGDMTITADTPQQVDIALHFVKPFRRGTGSRWCSPPPATPPPPSSGGCTVS